MSFSLTRPPLRSDVQNHQIRIQVLLTVSLQVKPEIPFQVSFQVPFHLTVQESLQVSGEEASLQVGGSEEPEVEEQFVASGLLVFCS